MGEITGEKRRGREQARGLIRILSSYKFTIVENTPIDQEIALDPELLGKVFENLLASYNEETKTTARKQTGSFYTPRPIVDYMVDESLKAYLARALEEAHGMKEEDVRAGLDILFAYTEKETPFNDDEVETLIEAIDRCKILDPACGSGAFPMGALHKLVYILSKLDPANERWKQRQLARLESPAMRQELERTFENNTDDYGRKLYLIENCLYGVDIQPIAIQLTKLRFFISLICDQKTNRNKVQNHGVRPLPNLETKFVAADTLIKLPKDTQMELFKSPKVEKIERELQKIRHDYFSVQKRQQKLALQRKDRELRQTLAEELVQSSFTNQETSLKLARWDPYDPRTVADFFEPIWMFDRSIAEGFDIVIGNPPYIQIQKFPNTQKEIWVRQEYETYAATADIYCLFYEGGAQLLREGGHLCYISSNKWMRAGYGEKLRGFLACRVNTRMVLDFGMAQNFGAATTYTCILLFTREPPDGRVFSCYAEDDRAAMEDPDAYFRSNAVVQQGLNAKPWLVLSKRRQEIKARVEKQGIPLKDWDIEINYGIKTGCNDAFYITTEQRNAFIAEDPACEEIIVPLLRGRFVERYAANWDGTWMINTHNGVKALGIPRIDARKYPPIWRHLSQYKSKLEKRQDKGDHWSNLRNCVYIEEFRKPKILYPNMTKYLPFFYDETIHFYTNDKGFIITSDGDSLAYLTAFLNSSLFRCCFRDNFPELMGNTYEVRKIFVDEIPVKKPGNKPVALFDRLVSMIQAAKKSDAGDAVAQAQFLEDLIDACIMEVYFPEHMAERDLRFMEDTRRLLGEVPFGADEQTACEAALAFTAKAKAPDHPIRNRLIRLTADSPDLLAVIKAEGAV